MPLAMNPSENITEIAAPAPEIKEYDELIVNSTEHLNELNREEGWDAEYIQMEQSPLEARFQVREYPDILAAKEWYSTRMEIRCAPPPGMIALLVSSPGDRCMEADGESMGDRAVHVIWPGGLTHFLTFRSDGGHIVHFDAAAFETTYRHLYPGAAPLPRNSAQIYPCTAEQVQELRICMDELVLEPSTRFSTEERASAIKSMLLDIVISADGWPSNGAHVTPATRQHVALLARDYIESQYHEPVTMELLCAHTAGSARTLQRAFIEHFEVTPIEYLKLRRLNAAHRDLMQHHNGGSTIAEIAMKHGFSHLGRFSRDYRKLFHELPRETLGR